MTETRWTRIGVLTVLSVLLLAVFMGTGMMGQERQPNDVSSVHVGEQVEIEGVVSDTNPVRIEYRSASVTVLNAEAVAGTTIERGDHVAVVGRIDADRTLVATDVVVQKPWESRYMYAISLLAGIWVLVRFLRQWRLDVRDFVFHPQRGDGD